MVPKMKESVLLELDSVEIKDVVIESTIINGEVVFEREQECK